MGCFHARLEWCGGDLPQSARRFSLGNHKSVYEV